MRRLAFVFRSVLALALLGSNVPAWACVDACGKGGQSLACVKACAKATALFTRHGALPDLGKGSCHVKVDAAQDLSLAAAPALAPAPSHAVLAPALAPLLPALAPQVRAEESRGPPPGSAYLLCQHPFANGPPKLV